MQIDKKELLMNTKMSLEPIRYTLTGNNNPLKNSYDYIRLFLIVISRLELRKAFPSAVAYSLVANFADRFDKEPFWTDMRW